MHTPILQQEINVQANTISQTERRPLPDVASTRVNFALVALMPISFLLTLLVLIFLRP
jgi:hypothetical protein